MQPLRLGIAGLGYWAKNYIRIVRQRNDVVLDAICDTDLEKLQYWQKQVGVAHAYREVKELCRHNLDGIIIVTPAATHYALVRCALEHRIPVLVEKPLTLKSRHAEKLCSLSEKYHVPLVVGHTYLFAQPVQYLVDLVKRGTLGPLSYIHSIRVNCGIVRSDCDVIWDLAPHDVAILLRLLGHEPLNVMVLTSTRKAGSKPDHAVIGLEFPDGVQACVTVSWLWPEKVRKLTVIGNQGAACYEDKGLESPVRLYSWSGQIRDGNNGTDHSRGSVISQEQVCPAKEPLAEVVEQFIRCIGGGNQCISNGPFALKVVKVLERISRSAKKLNHRLAPREAKLYEPGTDLCGRSLAHV